MKKNLVSLVMLLSLVSLVSMTSCKKEEVGDGSRFYATMEQCTDQYGKTVLSEGVLSWTANDQVVIYGTAGSGIYAAQPQTPATNAVFNNVSGHSGEAPYYAIYPADIATAANTVTLPATQATTDGSLTGYPMYAESADNHLAFKNLCGLLKLHLTKTNTSVSSITITANSEINGNYTVNYNGGNPTLAYVSGGTNTTTLTCTTAQAIDNGADFYVYLPAGSYTSLSIAITNDENITCTKSTNAGVTVNVYRSQYTTISLGENDLDFSTVESGNEGALSGLFTVGVVNGDTIKVRFSQGNLQYQASTQTWRFAENQWDYVGTQTPYYYYDGNYYYGGTVSGSDNSNISSTYSGWIDLFSWGTGGNPTFVSYSNSDYTTFVDWGSNAISNGGNTTNNGWRTLSRDEWYYLINTRENTTNLGTANARYAKGKVNNVQGVILFPDGYSHPSAISTPLGINFTGYGWNNNSYTYTEWADMEAAGAVFLPAAGLRYITSVELVGYEGGYWSSTPDGDDWNAYMMNFSRPNFSPRTLGSLAIGHSVRLVRNNN